MTRSEWQFFFDNRFPGAVKVQVVGSSPVSETSPFITCPGVFMAGFDGRPRIQFGDSNGVKSFDLWVNNHKIVRNSEPFIVELNTDSGKFIFSDHVGTRMNELLSPVRRAKAEEIRRASL